MSPLISSAISSDTLAALRADFPILNQELRPGLRLTYLDSGATSQKPKAVLEAMEHYYEHMNANVHRGVHAFAERATGAFEAARQKAADLINAADAQEIVFTRNTTESINLVARSWGDSALHAGDVIISTEMEHHANIVPWQMLAERTGAQVRYIPITETGTLDMEAYHQLLAQGKAKLVAVAHVSNMLGTINPVKEIVRLAHEAGALALIDAAQSVPGMPVDVRDIDADFIAFSAHKMLGPTGIGVLYGKYDLLEKMPPYNGGGGMISKVTLAGTKYAHAPTKFEAGTPAIAEAVGLGAAVDYLTRIGLQNVLHHEQVLVRHAMERLSAIPDLVMYGPRAEERAGVISFTVKGLHAHDLAQGLDAAGVAVRAGHHCTMPLHDKLGIAASLRASFYVYNSIEEVETLASAVENTQRYFA